MRGYGRDYRAGGRYGRDGAMRDYDIDYGYRRGGFEGSSMGRADWGYGGGGGMRGRGGGGGAGGWSGTAGRFGGGGPWSAYGSGEMGINVGGGGRNSGPRRGTMRGGSMRYDIGYGLGNDREWF